MAKRTTVKKRRFIQRHSTPIFRWAQVTGIIGILTKLFFNHSDNVDNHAEEMRNHDRVLKNQMEVNTLLKTILEDQRTTKTDAFMAEQRVENKIEDINNYMRDHH